nr:hypothetical protein [Tanacetum cinerariifolium]
MSSKAIEELIAQRRANALATYKINQNIRNGNGNGSGSQSNGGSGSRTYDISWKDLMKTMTEAYCLRNKIQNLESELWNLTVKGRKKSTISRLSLDKTCNNDKNLSEVHLEHEKEDEFVVVVVKEDGGEGDEKLEWWFEQDIDKEEERFEEMKMVLEDVGRRFKIQKKRKRCFEKERKDWNKKIHHHFHQWNHPMDKIKVDDLEWRRMS